MEGGPLKAIILAAGEGKRLRPHTLTRPKCLVEVNGRSLLERQIDVLRSTAGVLQELLVVGGYRADMLEIPGVELRHNPHYSETNMVWTLFCVEGEITGDVIVSYGDIVYDRGILEALLASEEHISVAIDRNWEEYWTIRNEHVLEDAETLKLSSDGMILELGQIPKDRDEIEGQFMGLMKFSSRGVGMLKEAFETAVAAGGIRGKPVQQAYMTDLLQFMIDRGHRVASVLVEGDWVEVDTVKDLELQETAERLDRIAAGLVGEAN